MTVAALPSTADYIENGSTKAFPAPFRFKAGNIAVTRLFEDGTTTVLAAGSDYTVTGGTTDAGGTVTVSAAAPAGTRLHISRATPRAQTMDYTAGDRFPAESHEGALDTAMLIAQELDASVLELGARSILSPPGDTGGVLPGKAARAGKVLGFSVAGALMMYSASALAAIVAPYLPANLKGDPGSGGNVAVGRAQLKTRPVTPGDVWYLNEGDRSGKFRVREAGFVGPADPDEGLYIQATNGFWFERIVKNNRFAAAWWGIGAGFVDTITPMPFDTGEGGVQVVVLGRTCQYMANLLPDGATLQFPLAPKTNPIKLARAIQFGQKSVHIRGTYGKSWISTNPGSLCFTDGDGFFRLNGSNSSVKAMSFCDLRTTQGQISPSCIAVAGGVYANRQGNPVENIRIGYCQFYDVSAPSIVYDSNWQRSADFSKYQRTRNVLIDNNLIKGCDYEYQSCYGAENVRYKDNTVYCDNLGINRAVYGNRIIGCKDYYMHGNKVKGPGYGRADARSINIRDAAGTTGAIDSDRIPCENIHVYGNEVDGWPEGIDAGGLVDRMFIHDNVFINTTLPTATNQNTYFLIMQGNIDIGKIVVERNTVAGYDALYYLEFGYFRDVRINYNDFKSAGNRPNDQPSTGFATLNGADCSFFQAIGNTIQFPAVGGSVIRFPGCNPALRAQVWGNVVPEHFYPEGDARRPDAVAGGGGGGGGKVQTSPGGPLYDFATTPNPPSGTNVFAADGTWPALQRDPAP